DEAIRLLIVRHRRARTGRRVGRWVEVGPRVARVVIGPRIFPGTVPRGSTEQDMASGLGAVRHRVMRPGRWPGKYVRPLSARRGGRENRMGAAERSPRERGTNARLEIRVRWNQARRAGNEQQPSRDLHTGPA